MEDNQNRISNKVAQAIEDNLDEAAEELVEAFLLEYPSSKSASLSRQALRKWTISELSVLSHALQGEFDVSRCLEIYAGDMRANVDPLFMQLDTFIETWLFVARTLASFVWRQFAEDPHEAQGALASLEEVTLNMIRRSMLDFVDTRLVPGSLSREWRFTGSSADLEKRHLNGELSREKIIKSPIVSRFDVTSREREVIRLVAEGRSNGEIAQVLCISQNTVKNHLSRIFDKLNVGTRAEMTRLAVDEGLA